MSLLPDLRDRLLANVRAHGIARVVQGIAGITLLPYVLAHLTREEYGLWAWVLAVTGCLSLADLGLSQGNINPLARAITAGDRNGVSEVVTAAVTFHLAVAALVLLAVAVSRNWVTLPFSDQVTPSAFSVFVALTVAQGITVSGYPFGSLLSALQRLDLLYKIQVVQVGLQIVATVLILGHGGRVLALAWLQLALAAFQTVSRACLCLRLYPGIRPSFPQRRLLPALLSAGLPLVLLSIVSLVLVNFERVLLGFYVDLAAITQYAVAARMVMVARELPQVLLFSIIPASAALDVAGERAALLRLYRRSLRVAAVVVMPLIATIWVCGPWLLHAWLGHGFDGAARASRPLAFGLLIPMLSAPGVHILIGRSYLQRIAGLYAVWAVLFIVLDWLLISAFGFAGAGWGMLAVNLAGTGALLARFQSLGIDNRSDSWRPLSRAALGALIATAAAVGAAAIGRGFLPESRIGSLGLVLLAGGTLWSTFGCWAWLSGFLEVGERTLLAPHFRATTR